MASLAADEYEKYVPDLDEFFTEHRFIRTTAIPPKTMNFPVLTDEQTLRGLILAMYAVKHLRGNAILDAAHENTTYTPEEVAKALVDCRLGLSGGFLEVA